jgi:hypothetical protein
MQIKRLKIILILLIAAQCATVFGLSLGDYAHSNNLILLEKSKISATDTSTITAFGNPSSENPGMPIIMAKSSPPKCNVDTITKEILKAPTIQEFYKKFVAAYGRQPNLLEKNCWRRYFYWKKEQQSQSQED